MRVLFKSRSLLMHMTFLVNVVSASKLSIIRLSLPYPKKLSKIVFFLLKISVRKNGSFLREGATLTKLDQSMDARRIRAVGKQRSNIYS